MTSNRIIACVLGLVLATADRSAANTFGSGVNTFEIEFVTIDDPGNPADTTGDPSPAGSVDDVYRIGKYEISRGMIEEANDEGGLGIRLHNMTNAGGNGPNQPATGINWFEAAAFVNWLNSSLLTELAAKGRKFYDM